MSDKANNRHDTEEVVSVMTFKEIKGIVVSFIAVAKIGQMAERANEYSPTTIKVRHQKLINLRHNWEEADQKIREYKKSRRIEQDRLKKLGLYLILRATKPNLSNRYLKAHFDKAISSGYITIFRTLRAKVASDMQDITYRREGSKRSTHR